MIGILMRLPIICLRNLLQCLIAVFAATCALTAVPIAAAQAVDSKRELVATAHWLCFPVKTGAPKRPVTITSKGLADYRFEIELADGDADWWAPLDLSRWKGRSITVSANQLPEGSRALRSLRLSDEIIGKETLYREPLRPQFHFSARRGWNNDPNGLAFYNGEYHLFFQHNPYGWDWGNMHWGHATSRDLVHWSEHGDVLFPDAMGPMFSGSAVVDWQNSSGLGARAKPPLVLIYTAAGNPATQCLAFSVDGREFTKYSGNPVLSQITEGNRDPKVFWHESTRRWVMVLYVGFPEPAKAEGNQARRDTIHILSSPDLKNWTLMSKTEGFYECPDLFELDVEDDPAVRKWVLTAANSDYMVGTFDGARFTPETGRLKGNLGRGFYAAQTFSDCPDDRRIQIGWLQAPSPGMPFNQAMTLPQALSLRSTSEGLRLARQPVEELNTLRLYSTRRGPLRLKEGDPNPFANAGGELLELRADFEPGDASEVSFTLRGIPIVYDPGKGELSLNGQRAPAPLRSGRQNLIVYADRTAFEVFADDRLVYVPMPVIPSSADTTVRVSARGGTVRFSTLDLHVLRSIWNR
jgi:fructan beta-fructosidase